MKINFDVLMKEMTDQLKTRKEVPRLLLHACCAPCASVALERLTNSFSLTAYYYNPNITDPDEYKKRAAELERLIHEMPMKHRASFVCARLTPSDFLTAIRGMEDLPEGAARCAVCFGLRLEESARYAAEHDFEYFTTSLTLSPLKDAALLNKLGEEAAERHGLRWLPSDFKKREGVKRSKELCEMYGIYRQNYCGCDFSKRHDYAKV